MNSPTSLVANTAEAPTTLVAEVVLTTTVEDGYRQTAEIRKYREGYEVHIRESFEDGFASNVYLRGGHFTKLVDLAAEHGIRCNSFDALTERVAQLESRLRADEQHVRGLDLGARSKIEQQRDALTEANARMRSVLEKADQQLSGIQYYSDCKTARAEAGLIRKDIRAEIMAVTP